MTTITLDAAQLNFGTFSVSGAAPLPSLPQSVELAPGMHTFGSRTAHRLLSRSPLTGRSTTRPGPWTHTWRARGSTTLCVYGYLVGIDASRLAPPSFRVSDPSTGVGVSIDTNLFHCISLLPGTYEFACGFTLGFVIEYPGVFTYDRTLEPTLTGYDTQRLHVVADPAAVPVAA